MPSKFHGVQPRRALRGIDYKYKSKTVATPIPNPNSNPNPNDGRPKHGHHTYANTGSVRYTRPHALTLHIHIPITLLINGTHGTAWASGGPGLSATGASAAAAAGPRRSSIVGERRLLFGLHLRDALHEVIVPDLRALPPQGEHACIDADRLGLRAVEVVAAAAELLV